ncbi:5938_t:CDS:10 [Ambispora leptoticha]|uniref:Conserved oligomeric Golgi complex subunit 4 n=1 Tax=Ambispora leptoticha TaxID=144679 RepID=A0A9N9E5Q3_9GLOM|nr:5938_t:CDS:10 [Ambispora leptoticha]
MATDYFTSGDASQLSLEKLRSLTNIEEIQECLRILDLEENQVDVDLDILLERRGQLEAELDKLEALRPQLGALSLQATNLLSIINGTSNVAERISAQVRQLDLEQSRVQETIEEVENVQELKLCINGMHSAMQMRDYEAAANYVHRASELDPRILNGEFAENAVPSSEYPDVPTKTLSDAKASLFSVFSKEFDAAVQNRDENNISRFFRLFPLIAIKPNFYADALTKLFENIAVIIDQHHPVVETHYGAGKMIRVLERLQEECDKQSRIILNTFGDEKQLMRKVADIRSYNNTPRRMIITPHRTGGQSRDSLSVQPRDIENMPDTREIDAVLTELAMISQRAHLYFRFMESRIKSEAEAMKINGVDVSLEKSTDDYNPNSFLSNSGLMKQIKHLINDYFLVEEYFLRRALEQAVEIDKIEEGNSTSSCVDDVFYILKRSAFRAVSTSNVDCIVTMVNIINQCLETEFIKVHQKRLILLNNLDVSCDYIQRLASELQDDATRTLAPLPEDHEDCRKAQKSLSSLSDSAINKFKQILQSGLEQLFKQLVKPRIRPILQEAYKDIKYVLNEDEYHDQESNDNFAKRFVNGFDSLLHIYKMTLTENNYNQIMIHLLDWLLFMWEKTILATKFNQLGALRFDKDLRAVSNYFSSRMQWSFRDKFTRLNQISTLLNLESLSEIYDYWGSSTKSSNPITWRLTITEARKVLGLRIEFKTEDVANIKL